MPLSKKIARQACAIGAGSLDAEGCDRTDYIPQHVLAVQKSRMAMFVRTIGIDRARVKTGMENLAHNFNRLVLYEFKPVPA